MWWCEVVWVCQEIAWAAPHLPRPSHHVYDYPRVLHCVYAHTAMGRWLRLPRGVPLCVRASWLPGCLAAWLLGHALRCVRLAPVCPHLFGCGWGVALRVCVLPWAWVGVCGSGRGRGAWDVDAAC